MNNLGMLTSTSGISILLMLLLSVFFFYIALASHCISHDAKRFQNTDLALFAYALHSQFNDP